jgi:hypothetical protein
MKVDTLAANRLCLCARRGDGGEKVRIVRENVPVLVKGLFNEEMADNMAGRARCARLNLD